MNKFIRFGLLLLATSIWAANDVPVPSACTPVVNQRLAQLLTSGTKKSTDNVMVCGITTGPSTTQFGGPHGNHQILSVRAAFPDHSTQLIEVVTNDSLDGVVTAPANANVFAYGTAFFSNTHQFAAGIDQTHCATHFGADNGWVVVNGQKYPKSCDGSTRRARSHRQP